MTTSAKYLKHIDSETLKNLKIASTLLGFTMKDFTVVAIREKIERSGLPMNLFKFTVCVALQEEASASEAPATTPEGEAKNAL